MAILTLLTLGVVEGLTEFIPVSSSGHLIVAHTLLGAAGPDALSIDAILQLGAGLALVIYFRKELLALVSTFFRIISGKRARPEEGRLLWALIAGTVPAVVLGLLLEKKMETIFRNTHLVAYALITGSLLMFFAEFLSRQTGRSEKVPAVGLKKGFFIGLFQALALIPGMSRSGMTIAGGMYLGLNRESAAKFGFLLSIPVILGSGAKKILEISQAGALPSIGIPLLLGTFAAFASAFLVIHWLLSFLRRSPLYVFVIYRILFALIILFFIPT